MADPGRGGAAVGNLEDARVAADVLGRALDDALYLDDDALERATPAAEAARALQAQQRRMLELKAELADARTAAAAADAARLEAEARVAKLQAELADGRAALDAHVQELVAKADEVERLKAVVAALAGGKAAGGGDGGGSAGQGGGNGGGGEGGGRSAAPPAVTPPAAAADAGHVAAAPPPPDARVIAARAELDADRLAAEMLAQAEADAAASDGGLSSSF